MNNYYYYYHILQIFSYKYQWSQIYITSQMNRLLRILIFSYVFQIRFIPNLSKIANTKRSLKKKTWSSPHFRNNTFDTISIITIPSSYRVFLRLSVPAEFVPHGPHTHPEPHDEHADSRHGYQGDSYVLRGSCVGRRDFWAERWPLDLVLLCRRLGDTGGWITLALFRLLRLQLGRFWYAGGYGRWFMR